MQITRAGQLTETLRVQAVQADVQPGDAGLEQRRGESVQLRAVGGHAQFTQAGQGGDFLAKPDHAGTHQRFTAGKANLARAQRHEALGHLVDFFQ